jgi:tetratricopeptide (TPR) repeat protein/NAD-dependent SIR2 family protein deacetylase
LTDSTKYKTILEQLISKISEKIKLQETAIFCGAGISFNSGLPLATDLSKYILNLLNVNENDAEKILPSNIPFEAIIQTLADEVDIDSILDVFSKGKPNTNHQLIAELIKLGFVKTVITTNFDALIEKSLNNAGLIERINYQVYSTEKEFENIDWNSNIIKIIKIHGSITNKEEMAITLELVARRTINQIKNKIVSSFFTNTINPYVLILGYSCSDSFDITPQIQSLKNNKSQIFFLEHNTEPNNINIEDISLMEFKNPFVKFKGQRINLNTDIFVKYLWKSILPLNYELKISSIFWKENMNKWILESAKYSLGIKNQISARLFYDIGEYELSIKIWEQGLTIAQEESNQILFYAQLGNLGMALNAIGKFEKAKKCLEESVKACSEIGNIQGEISQLQALGNVYRNLRDFDNSIKVFNKAIFLSEINELNSLCSSLGNLATVYNQIEDHCNAIKILQKGIAIAIETGNIQAEGSMLTSFGIAYFQKGEFDKAVTYFLKSINITRQIGDRQGECMSLHNLSNFCLQINNYENCLKYSKLSLKIAKEIGIRQSEAGAYYNIGTAYFFKGEHKSAIFHLEKAIDIYSEIFGKEHSHTISAINALNKVVNYPDSTKMIKMQLKQKISSDKQKY